ncbi:MAG: hypothetical protein R3348_05775 [Xanthomonadales bacterium]|nr:hypothetical protein [Xanthomonadales bacterium]
MYKSTTVLLLAAALVACSSSPPRYEMADSDTDYGYSESQITDNRYRISYKGRSSTGSDAVKDMALLRAAELTRLNGYDWFRVLHQESDEQDDRAAISTSMAQGTRVYRSCGLLGCTTTAAPSYSHIMVTSAPGRDSYSTSIEIVMGEGEVEDRTSVYDAAELFSYLSARYSGS